MNGRRPTMCVTVLQSQPSVSIPTLTMQRTSRPGGWSGRSSFARQLLEALGVDRPALRGRVGQSRLPTVSSVKRIQRDSSFFAPSTSVSATTFESTRIVYARAVVVPKRREVGRRNARRRLALGEPVVDHRRELRVLADEDEHRRPLVVAFALPLLPQLLPREREQADRMLRVLAAPPRASGSRACRRARRR